MIILNFSFLLGKDLPEIFLDQIEVTNGPRKSFVSFHTYQESEGSNDFLQRKIFDKRRAETETISQTSKIQHDQLNNTKKFRLHHLSKQNSNNERNETTKMTNSTMKTHDNRATNSYQVRKNILQFDFRKKKRTIFIYR